VTVAGATAPGMLLQTLAQPSAHSCQRQSVLGCEASLTLRVSQELPVDVLAVGVATLALLDLQ
jgi:hypothetical protein